MIRVYSLLLVTFLLISCGKETAEISGNWLEMKITDSQGRSVQGAEIYLYKDKIDWANFENPVTGPFYSDASGTAYIKGLDRGMYFFNIAEGEKNNRFTKYILDKPVKIDAITRTEVVIRPLTTWEGYLSGGSSRKWKLLRLKTLDGTPFLDYPVITDMLADGRWYDSNGRLGLWWFSKDEKKIFYDYNASGAIVESKMVELRDDYFKARIDFFGIAMLIEMVPEE